MLYEAKEGTKAYEYIKGILDAEEKERQAYIERVKKAVGFEFYKYRGYQPNSSLLREYEVTAIWVPSERYETLDKKIWRKFDSMMLEDGYYVAVAPNKRSKQGKAVAAVLSSYKAVTCHFDILKDLELKDLDVGVPQGSSFSITQLLRCNDRYFAFFDDRIRAEKRNPDFKEITIGEYEDLINSDKEG